MIPKRRLGKINVDVTILGLGGEGILRTYGHEREAYELINQAIDFGFNCLDSAKAYGKYGQFCLGAYTKAGIYNPITL